MNLQASAWLNFVFVQFISTIFVSRSVSGLEVLGVVGGGAVVNGSNPLLVLDCHYNIPSGEEAGLVVKWYHGSNPRPVYQWIYGSPPQALGLLRGRVDLRYQPSPDRLKAHSSLAFVAPTTELAGQYTCRVATYLSEDSATGGFVVYTPATDFDLKMSKPSLGDGVLSCSAKDVYPEPTIALFSTDVTNGRRSLMTSRLQKQFDEARNLHSVAAEASILGHQLIGEIEFECILSVPGTDYRLKKTLLYYSSVLPCATAEAASGRGATCVAPAPLPSVSGLLIAAAVGVLSVRRWRWSS